ncbi:MAG TPA: C4-dicarboxylate transporter DctA [Kofleriaceae bacterium]|nr:C4-dicarboxylate transporter DctA [Kofleriaceae bacterium]
MRLAANAGAPDSRGPRGARGLHRLLYVQVLCGLVAGIVVGHLWPDVGTRLKPLGDGFIKLMRMMISPIVFCTIAGGISSLRDRAQIGKTLLKAMGLFYALTALALLTGLGAVFLLRPGAGLDIAPSSLDPRVAAQYTGTVGSVGVVEFILHMIPSTFFGAFTEHAVLPVLLIASLVGFALASVGRRGEPIARGIEALSAVLFAIFGFLVKLAPLGAFGAVAFTVGRYGVGSIASLGWLIMTFYVACLFFVLVVLGLLARLHGFRLWKLLRYVREELLIVLGTSSTEPVLPRLLVKLERLGCQKGVVGLVLPAGYSFNLDGTAIYLSLATVFLAQAMNIHLPPQTLLVMLLVMLLTSKGAAGVTGSGFVALVATLTVFPEIPVAAVAIIVGIDRFMSEARALTSCASNAVAVIVVSMWGRACDRAVLQRELDGPAGPAADGGRDS